MHSYISTRFKANDGNVHIKSCQDITPNRNYPAKNAIVKSGKHNYKRFPQSIFPRKLLWDVECQILKLVKSLIRQSEIFLGK